MKVSYRELERRLARAMEVNSLAQQELKRWCEGFVNVCALLKVEKPEHIFVKALPESILKLVEEKYACLVKDRVDSDSNIRDDSGIVSDEQKQSDAK